MNNKRSSPQPLRRLRWIILCLGILVISLIEVAHLLQRDEFLSQLAIWLIGAAALAGLILYAFREVARLQRRMDSQLEDSRLQLQRQAVLVQLSLKLAPTLQEEHIANLVTQELQHAMGYPHVELQIFERDSSKDHLPPASPFYNPARQDFLLQAGGQVLGILTVENQDQRAFSAQDHAFLNAVANQAALAIANSRLLESQQKQRLKAEQREAELRSQQRTLHILNEITQAALQSPDLPTLLHSVARELGSLFRADHALIALWDEQRQQPKVAAHYSANPTPGSDPEINVGDLSLLGEVISSGKALAIKEAEKTPNLSPYLRHQLQIQSLLALPLITSERRLGAAVLVFQNQHNFTQSEVNLGEQAASQIALAIARVSALKAAQERAHELDALQRATTALLNTIELEALLSQILDASLSAIPAAQHGLVHLIERDTGQLQLRAVHGQTDPRIRAMKRTSESGFTAQAVRERRPLLIPELRETAAKTNVSGAAIIAPLVVGEECLGAISLESDQQAAFTEADLSLLVSFAATATTAIQNAQLHAEVQKQAITDTLTGFYNRRGFIELGRREVERSLRFGHPLSALMLDIDLFKQINDLYGHLTGDRILVGMTSRCAQELRQIDLLGRYGGDEFIVLLPETSLENACLVAERLRASIARIPFSANGKPLYITISVGVASLRDDCKTLESLMERADQALYQAKENGRNRVATLL